MYLMGHGCVVLRDVRVKLFEGEQKFTEDLKVEW